MAPNLKSIRAELRRWFSKETLDHLIQVDIEETAEGPKTTIHVEGTLQPPPFRRPRIARIGFTTRTRPINEAQFSDSKAREPVAKARTDPHNRVIYVLDHPGKETIGAIVIHVSPDTRLPIMVTDILLRTDSESMSDTSAIAVSMGLLVIAAASRLARRDEAVCASRELNEPSYKRTDVHTPSGGCTDFELPRRPLLDDVLQLIEKLRWPTRIHEHDPDACARDRYK